MRVGTSLRGFPLSPFLEDHPRACGDKKKCIQTVRLLRGSSPCVWGQVKLFKLIRYIHRIIPMRVGTSY